MLSYAEMLLIHPWVQGSRSEDHEGHTEILNLRRIRENSRFSPLHLRCALQMCCLVQWHGKCKVLNVSGKAFTLIKYSGIFALPLQPQLKYYLRFYLGTFVETLTKLPNFDHINLFITTYSGNTHVVS